MAVRVGSAAAIPIDRVKEALKDDISTGVSLRAPHIDASITLSVASIARDGTSAHAAQSSRKAESISSDETCKAPAKRPVIVGFLKPRQDRPIYDLQSAICNLKSAISIFNLQPAVIALV
jgi:hypothetical protein